MGPNKSGDMRLGGLTIIKGTSLCHLKLETGETYLYILFASIFHNNSDQLDLVFACFLSPRRI